MTSLITGKLNPKRIIIGEPDLRIKRDEKGDFNLNSIMTSLKKVKKDPKFLSKILLRRVIINKGRIKFSDLFNQEKPFESQYEELEINIRNFSFTKPVGIFIAVQFPNGRGDICSLEFKGIIDKLPIDFDLKKINLNAKLYTTSFNLLQFFPYYKNYLPFPNLDGVTNIKASWSGNLSDHFHLEGNIKFNSLLIDYPKFYSNPIKSGAGGLKFNLKIDRDLVNIKDYQIKMNDLVLTGSCLLEKLHSEERNIALEIESNLFSYEEWKNFIPERIFHPPLTKFLKENLRNGEVKLNSLKISGKVKNIAEKSSRRFPACR